MSGRCFVSTVMAIATTIAISIGLSVSTGYHRQYCDSKLHACNITVGKEDCMVFSANNSFMADDDEYSACGWPCDIWSRNTTNVNAICFYDNSGNFANMGFSDVCPVPKCALSVYMWIAFAILGAVVCAFACVARYIKKRMMESIEPPHTDAEMVPMTGKTINESD